MSKENVFKYLLCILFLVAPFCAIQADDFTKLRNDMAKYQIKARGVKDMRVIKAMELVERHKFVPPSSQKYAYDDRPLSIGYGQTISQPYIVALMTELLSPEPEDKVLEIGTGSGYQAAILAELAACVYTIEVIPELAKKAEQRLKILNYKNVFVRCGDGYLGWPKEAPFDKIIVTCSPKKVPQTLIDQLKEGGRMVIPIGDWPQKLFILHKKEGKIIKQYVADVLFVPMKHKKR